MHIILIGLAILSVHSLENTDDEDLTFEASGGGEEYEDMPGSGDSDFEQIDQEIGNVSLKLKYYYSRCPLIVTFS